MLDMQLRQPRTLEEVISYMRQLEDHLRWALSNIDGETQITEGTVGQKQIAQGAISSSNIAKGAVTGDALEDGAIAEDKLSDAVLSDIDKRIKKANSSMLASNEMKDRVNDLIALADINWHKIVDEDGQILTAEGEKIRFSRLAIDAGNLQNIGIGQIIIRMEDGLYAITQGGNEKLEITADDAEMLSELLHRAYLSCSASYAENPSQVSCKEMNAAREYRNTVAALINKTYCGNDA